MIQTAGVKIDEDFQKRVWGGDPQRVLCFCMSKVLILRREDIRILQNLVLCNMWSLESHNNCLLRLFRLQIIFRMKMGCD